VLSRKLSKMTVRAYQQRATLMAREAGVDETFSPHWLRHTFAVTFLEGSQDSPARALVRLKNKLGQKDARSCHHYLTMSRKDDKEDIARIFPSRKRMTLARSRREFEGRAGI
jgi:site-specific recombinase XerD